MAVYILSALLIIILAFAIVQLSKKSEVEAEIEKLKKRNQLSLMAELRAAEKVVWLCFTGGLLLTANYAITYFSGSELVNIPNWGFIQWSGAFIGLVIAVSITFVQKVLYSSPTHSKAGLVVTTLVLTFVIISEIGSPIEKEGMKMKEASQNSAVFKAVVGEIKGGTDATSSYSSKIAEATSEKAQHEFELGRCERHTDKGEKRVKRCEDFENRAILQAQAKIDSFKSSANTTTSSNESSRLALIQQAKELEHNTNHHSELVKLTASVLGASFLSSMMFLSLVLIVAFEAGFHFVGSRIGVLKTALGEMGNKEILREQELVSLKREKKFQDQSGYINPDDNLNVNGGSKESANKSAPSIPEMFAPKHAANTGYVPATAFNPVDDKASNNLGFKSVPVGNNMKQKGVNIGIVGAANEPEINPNNRSKSTVAKPALKPVGSNRGYKQNQGDTHGSKKVNQDRGDTVNQTVSPRSEVEGKSMAAKVDFDDIYLYVKQQIKEGKCKLSIRDMRKAAHAFIKSKSGKKIVSLSIIDTNRITEKVKNRMLSESFIIENPSYSNGKAKYLLVQEEGKEEEKKGK